MAWVTDPETGELVWVPDGGSTDPNIGKVITVGNKVMQYNPATGLYDIEAGDRPAPQHSTSSSFSTSQSFQDPRALELQAQQLAQSWQQWQSQFGQSLAEFNYQKAQDATQMNFLRDKFAWEQETDNRANALATVGLMNQIQGRMEQTEIARQSMIQQAMATNAQFQMQADQLNEQARVANLEQRQSVARDIAEFTRRPGDVGAAAGFLRAGGGSPISTAIAEGKSAITPESLAILNSQLAVSDEVMKDPQRIQAPQIVMPQFTPQEPFSLEALMGMLGQAGAQQPAPAMAVAAPTSLYTHDSTGAALAPGTPAPTTVGASSGVQWRQDDSGRWVSSNTDLMNLENGGLLDGMAWVGDSSDGKENKELAIGNAMVIPEDDIPKELRKHLKGKKKLQDGGTVGNPLMRAQTFLEDAARIAMQSGGFSSVPTPVGMSAPGTSPYLQTLGAAVASTARGIPQELFLEEIMRSTPQGIRDGVARRTR